MIGDSWNAKAIEYVAGVLGCPSAELTIASHRHAHPVWDSFGHVLVMISLERDFGVIIDDESTSRYAHVSAIAALLEDRSSA
jgi:acyl carrier protein